MSTSATLAASAAILLTAAPAVAAGPKWTAAPPITMPPGALNTLLQDVTLLSPADVWAVGSFADDAVHPFAVHWNGTEWTVAPTPPGAGVLDAVDAVATDDVWAVGETVLHYDGTAWQPFPSPASAQNDLEDVDLRTAADGWAVGRSGSKPLILRWQAGRWTRLDTPPVDTTAELTSVVSLAADDAWAVGTRERADGTPAALVLHWNGVEWKQEAVPDPGGEVEVNTVAATPKGVWVAGATCGVTCSPLVLLRSPTGAWKPVPADGGNEVTEVVVFAPDDVWTIGYGTSPLGWQTDHVEHWDGKVFTNDPSVRNAEPPSDGQPGSAIALAAGAGDPVTGSLWAVGWSEARIRAPRVIHRG